MAELENVVWRSFSFHLPFIENIILILVEESGLVLSSLPTFFVTKLWIFRPSNFYVFPPCYCISKCICCCFFFVKGRWIHNILKYNNVLCFSASFVYLCLMSPFFFSFFFICQIIMNLITWILWIFIFALFFSPLVTFIVENYFIFD